jgi:hypothetical protein
MRQDRLRSVFGAWATSIPLLLVGPVLDRVY